MTPARVFLIGAAICFGMACIGIGALPWVPLGLLLWAISALFG